jgi:MSHA biogenesis protein MshQ
LCCASANRRVGVAKWLLWFIGQPWLLFLIAFLLAMPARANLNSATASFSPASVAAGQSSTLTITIGNQIPGNPSGIQFSVTYPAGLMNAPIPNATSTCSGGGSGGTVTASANGNSLGLSGASLTGTNTCTITVQVVADSAGSYVLPAITVTSSAGSRTTTAQTLIATTPASPSPPLADFRFDECSWTSGSAGVVTDSAGSYSGTPYNVSAAASGVVQRAADLSVSGTSDYIQWPIGLMNGRNDFTITLWFKTTANQAQQEIFQGLGSTVSNDQIEIYLMNTNQIVVNILDSGDITYTSGTTLNDGAWHHLAVSRSGANACVYIDGTSLGCNNYGSGALSITNASALMTGQEQDGYGGSFAANQALLAQLDEFKVFASALNIAQIKIIRANELNGVNWDGSTRSTTCLIPKAEYRFDECSQYSGGAGQVLDTGGSYHGTPLGSLQNGTPGQIQRFADFSAASRYVDIPSGPALTSNWTLTTWFKLPFATSATHSIQYYVLGSVAGGGDFLYLDRASSGGSYRWGVYSTAASDSAGSGGQTDGTFRFGSLSNGWHHLTLVGSGNVTKLYIDGVYQDQVSRRVKGTFRYLGASYDNAGSSSGQSFGTPLDEFMIFDVELTASQISSLYSNELAGNNFDGTARSNTCISLNHLRIEHSGNGVTCAPTTLTLKACADASCSSYYTGGVTGTLTAAGTPTVNWVGGANFAIGATGLATKDVQATTAGNVTWGASGVAPVASNGTTCYIGATNSCSFASNLAGFLFDVPNHASDTSQTITVSAVKQADNSLACTPAFASTSKTINFGCGYSNPATGTLPVVVGGSNVSCGSTSGVALNFNASGVASTTVRYADVGQMSLTASYTGSGGSEAGLVMTGSDTFIAAPASLLVTPAGPYVAGNSFNVTVAAKNTSGNTTPNFGKESTTENVTLGHALVGPAGGNDPALTGTTTIPDASFQSGNGSATVNNIQWAEVGDISITATLASASYLGSGLTASGSAAAGAFKPAYFDTVVTPGTGTFTYSGQPFTVQVTAKNAGGGTTLNYKGAYARIVTLSDGNSGTNNSATLGTFSNASIAAASFNNGVATTTTVSYRFNSKTTAPLEAPGSAPLKLRALDTDSVTSSGHTEGTTPIRAGRLRLVNFYGSELLKPRVEYRAEYWDGNRWATNTLDSSSPIVAGNIATGGLAVNSLTALNAGIGFITFNTAAAGSYDIALNLNAAGLDTSCNAAHGGTAANKSWLQGYWSAPANCGGVAAWAQDPNARIRLGASRAPYIYLRERY